MKNRILTAEQEEAFIQFMNNTLIGKSLVTRSRILQEMLRHKQDDGICYVTQSMLSNIIGISKIQIAKVIKKGKEDKAVQVLGGGKYIIDENQLFADSTIRNAFNIYRRVINDEEFSNLIYREQAEVLGLTLKEVHTAWTYINESFKLTRLNSHIYRELLLDALQETNILKESTL